MPFNSARIMRRVYFKMVYTEHRRQYYVDPSWRIDDFINIMKTNIIRDFNIEQFEIVEAGQNTFTADRSEEGPALSRSETTLLRDKYGPNINVSFYIRPLIQQVQVQVLDECTICYETGPIVEHYTCRHAMCRACIRDCLQHAIHSCPMCRCQIIATN